MADTDCSTVSDDASLEARDNALEHDFSDDSSFYGKCFQPKAKYAKKSGQQTTKQQYQQKIPELDVDDYWRVHNWNLQVVFAREKPKIGNRKRENCDYTEEPKAKKSKQSGSRSAKSPLPPLATEPFNPYKDVPTALQIDESIDDFLHRLKPSAAKTLHPWIWCANFHAGSRETDPQLPEFKQIGTPIARSLGH